MGQLVSTLALHLILENKWAMEEATSFVFQNGLSQRCSHTQHESNCLSENGSCFEVRFSWIFSYEISSLTTVLFTYMVRKSARGILQHVTCKSFYFTWHICSIWGFLTWPRATSTSVWFFQILWSFFPVCLVSHNFWKFKRPINLFSNCLWFCPYWLHLGQ